MPNKITKASKKVKKNLIGGDYIKMDYAALPDKRSLLLSILKLNASNFYLKGQRIMIQVIITWAMAKEMLDNGLNIINRDPTDGNVLRLMKAIKDKLFFKNGPLAITFLDKGYICDGGNRLQALKEAGPGHSISVFVGIDFPLESVAYIDMGTRRKLWHSMNFVHKIKYRVSSFIGSICSIKWMGDETHKCTKTSVLIDHSVDYANLYMKELIEMDQLREHARIKKFSHLNRTYMWKAFLHYLIKDPVKAREFIRIVLLSDMSECNQALTQTNPQPFLLRQWLDTHASCTPFDSGQSIDGYKHAAEFIYRDMTDNKIPPFHTYSEAALLALQP